MASLTERYVASMILSGVGDAMGFKNGRWEFCRSGPQIHKELQQLGGIESLVISLPKWKVSDDTVMHLGTAEALVECGKEKDKEKIYSAIAKHYKKSLDDMFGRSVGITCRGAASLTPGQPNGCFKPFASRGGGCGAAMRAMCIGLRYVDDLDSLIAVSCESGRMTHHHPTGYLGAMAAALFVSYGIQGKPLREWGVGLLETTKKAKVYIEKQGRYVEENMANWNYFTDKWTQYLKVRDLLTGENEAKFPENYGVAARDEFYDQWSFDGWAGASGHDAPLVAYDALLSSGGAGNWAELCHRGMLHYGDSDSTGVIAGACYGAMYGFHGVPEVNYKDLEYRWRLAKSGIELLQLSYPSESIDESMKPLCEKSAEPEITEDGQASGK